MTLFRATVAFTLLLGATIRVRAQEPDTIRWTPDLQMRYQAIGGTALSPDGALVAYVVRRALMEGEQSEYLSHIWIVSADGRSNVQYTQGDESAGDPAFSPDGRYLTFTAARGGDDAKTQIWIMRVAGGEAERLTDAETGVGDYAWSPDGTRIAYTMRDPETEREKQEKKEKRAVVLVDRNFKYSHLYTIALEQNAEGERPVRRLTAGDFHVTGFDWSPDGSTIVFEHKPDPRINTGDSDLSLVPADSGAVTPLVRRPGGDGDPAWSPDGRTIAFVSDGGQPERIGLGDVHVVPAGGGEPRKLADTPNRSANVIAWSGDGREVLVSEVVGTSVRLIAVPAEGGAPRTVTTGDGVYGAFAFDRRRERTAFTLEDVDMPADVYVSPLRRVSRTRVTDLHAGVPRPTMGRTEVVSWTSPDGRTIEGLLTYPVSYDSGRRYPLILNVHGGPAGAFTRSFTGRPGIYMIQYFAQQGYAILRPNPRGSTGYGKAFRYANERDWGYGDLDDLLSGVDRAIELGVAHPDSLLLMGWSYGGYMTAFAVTRTDRFKAASMGAGLSNLISMATTTDIPDYLIAHMGAEIWEDYAVYEKHSAIYHIANVTTPTQVIHGENDDRVPTRQGQEMYVALRRRGVPTEMIVLPRTPHGPREPKLLMQVSPHILRWFEEHLGRKVAAAEVTP